MKDASLNDTLSTYNATSKEKVSLYWQTGNFKDTTMTFEVKEQRLRKNRVFITGYKITTKGGWYIDQLNIWVTTAGM